MNGDPKGSDTENRKKVYLNEKIKCIPNYLPKHTAVHVKYINWSMKLFVVVPQNTLQKGLPKIEWNAIKKGKCVNNVTMDIDSDTQ